MAKIVNFSSIVNAKRQILLFQDHTNLTIARRVRTGGETDPVATKTLLGWVVHGPIAKGVAVERVMLHSCQNAADEELNQMVKQSFTLDYFGVKLAKDETRSKEEERAEFLLRTTTERVGDRFQTGLLWKEDDFKFPESKQDALARCMKRKMNRDEKFSNAYCQTIDYYVTKGYARKLSLEEAGKTTEKHATFLT